VKQGWLIPSLIAMALAACGGSPPKPGPDQDGPGGSVDGKKVKDAVPRAEPRAKYGNRSPYEVLGKTYTVMDSAAGYRERGTASWYGAKFHGRRTSSGEPYDMYKATAAHRNLPLPTYAEVTNLDNGRKVIVKINDRGPFHSERLLDLSYGAAVKLDMLNRGTARVDIRAITFDEDLKLPGDTWLQAGAFKAKDSARSFADTLERKGLAGLDVDRDRGLYKVYVGPFRRTSDLNAASARIVEMGYDRPHTVQR
jgi:rare lipoprotein A